MKTISKKRNAENSKKKSSNPFFDLSEKSGDAMFFDQKSSTPFFTVQPKLTIGQPNDKYEHEADEMADKVVEGAELKNSASAKDQSIQTKCENCEEELQMQPIEEEEEELQMKTTSDQTATASPGFESAVKSKSNTGESLPNGIRQEMETGFGADFSNVNIHKDADAEQLSAQINAQAFAHGNDVYFNKGKYKPETKEGKHLLAHELTHVLQQQNNLQKSPDLISRACSSGTDKTWSEKVDDMNALSGADKNSCAVNMMNEALGGNVPVHQSTNTAADLEAAINAGHYTAWGSGHEINYDANFNAKTGDPNQFGEARFVTNNGTTTIYLVMGPNAINSVGPEFTEMAHQHEADHASDYTSQAASGEPHSATQGEELRIYTRGFTGFFLSLSDLDTSSCSYGFADDFSMMFNTYAGATDAEKNSAFTSIESFYTNTISGNADNEMIFKIWFQSLMNSRDAADALVTRINALSGLSLTRGTDPNTHLVCA